MSEERDKGANLLTNLGTNPADIEQGVVDVRRFGNHSYADRVFHNYSRLRAEMGSRFWALIRDEDMNLGIGLGGKARIQAIHGTAVERGATPNIEAEMNQPGMLSRIREVVQPGHFEAEEKKRLGVKE